MCPTFILGDENADFAEEKKMPKLTVYVYDVATGIGIPGVMVYLWKGPGGIEPPETADYSKPTDSEGKAVFDVYNAFRVSISNGRYEAADPYQAPPEEWKDVYSAIGAVGVVRDVTYPFPLRVIAPPPGKWWERLKWYHWLILASLAVVGAATAYYLRKS